MKPLRVVVAFVAVFVVLAFAPTVRAQDSAPASRKIDDKIGSAVKVEHGSYGVEKGVRVLRVHGTPREMGYAHGFLLASEIESFADVLLSFGALSSVKSYEKQVRPLVAQKFKFDAEEEDELAGMLEGMKAKLGRAPRMENLKRDVDIVDLKAGNALGDWVGFGCSSFSAWGPMTADGGTITARNFDYPSFPPQLALAATIIVHAPSRAGARRWFTIGYPGMIGVITGVNEEGVGAFLHDVPAPLAKDRDDLVPRMIALRRIMVEQGAKDAVASAAERLRAMTTYRGNNVHVTSPFDGKTAPAGVVEYDGVEAKNGGVDLRGPDDGRAFVLCTNHHRLRSEPEACKRYASIEAALKEAAASGAKIDAAKARDIMLHATQHRGSVTLHTIVLLPNEKRLEVMFTQHGEVAPKNDPVPFTFAELMSPPPR